MTRDDWKVVGIGLILAAGIFVEDLTLELGVAAGVPYIFLVLVAFWSKNPRIILAAAVTGSVLTIVGYFLSPPGGEAWKVLMNRFLALLVIWVTYTLCILYRRKELALRTMEEESQRVLNHTGALIVAIDADGKVKMINHMGCRLLGYPREEIIGRDWFVNFLPERDREKVGLVFNQLMTGEIQNIEYYENPVLTRSGEERIITWHNSLLHHGEVVTGILSSGIDITARRRAESELKENQRKFSTLISNLPGLVYRCRNDRKWTMEYLSEGCRDLTGYSSETFVNNREMAFNDLILEEDQERIWKDVQEAVRIKQPFRLTYRIRTSEGGIRWLWEQGQGVYSSQGDLLALEGFITDISDYKYAEEALTRSHEELRNLSNRLQSIREEEKVLIAREVHDELGQTLTALKMDLAWLESGIGSDRPELREKTCTMSKLIDTTINSVQRLCMELRPQILDVLGFCDAVEWQVREYEKRTGIRCQLQVSRENIDPDPDRSIALFRIVQEALTNVARHSGADQVQVSLKRADNKLTLQIQDNGVGISPHKVKDSQSIGLIGMRERALVWGGTLDIQGKSGEGTLLTVSVPCQDNGHG